MPRLLFTRRYYYRDNSAFKALIQRKMRGAGMVASLEQLRFTVEVSRNNPAHPITLFSDLCAIVATLPMDLSGLGHRFSNTIGRSGSADCFQSGMRSQGRHS